MNYRQLRYFVAVAEELNFSRAAAKLHVSQPPLSTQIKAIETELGTSLFERDTRRVRLTKAGAVLLEHARDTLAGLDRAVDMTRLAGRGEAGRLVVGFTHSTPMHDIFARLLRSFRARYPDVQIDARQMSTSRQLAALNAGEIDVGILRPPSWFRPPETLCLRRFSNDELNVFLPLDHALHATQGAIAVEALADERFICSAADLGCGLQEHTLTLCAQAGFRPRTVQEVSIAGSILGLVAAGCGIAILPRCQARSGVAGLVNRSIGAEDAMSVLQFAFRSHARDALLRTFVDTADEMVADARAH